MASTRDWLWYLQVALEGKEVIFALNAKGSFLLTMVNFQLDLIHHNYSPSDILSALTLFARWHMF